MRGSALALPLAAAVSAGAALAETEAAGWGIGISPARPEASASLGEGVRARAVLVNERTRQPASVIDRADTIRLEASLRPAERAPERRLALTCRVEFVAVDGVRSDGTEGACFRGMLRAGATRSQPLNLTFRFTPSPRDLSGTAGIILHLWDEVSGDEAILVPTYDWRGGR